MGEPGSPTYIELHCHSAYSFLDGASHPEELVVRAAELGYPALALTDHDGVYGSLEFAHAAKDAGVRPITGAEVTIGGGWSHLTLLVESSRGYANLCRILTAAHAGTRPEGKEHRVLLEPAVALATVAELNEGLVCLSGCARDGLRSATLRGRPGSQPRSGGSGSSSSSSGRTSGATHGGTPRSATWPSTSGSRPSRRGTSTRTPRGGRSSRTRSSRSAAGPRSTGASASGVGTARRCCARRGRWSSGSRASTGRRPDGRSRSQSACSSTSPPSSGTATPTSPTVPTRRSASSRRSASTRSRSATPRAPARCARRPAPVSRASSR